MKKVREEKTPRTRKVLVQSFDVIPDQKSKVSFEFDAKRFGSIKIFFEYEDEVTLFDVNEFRID